jgi:hypothetical protein
MFAPAIDLIWIGVWLSCFIVATRAAPPLRAIAQRADRRPEIRIRRLQD